MSWEKFIIKYHTYISIERNLSRHSIDAYMRDLKKMSQFFNSQNIKNITHKDILKYISYINEFNISTRSQARIISSIRSFFKFLIYEKYIQDDPCEHIYSPKIGSRLPIVLTIEEIDQIIQSIDLSKENGERNRTIIECLYSCGLRVSELTSLKISDIIFEDNIIKVIGKGNKERIIPLSKTLKKYLIIYINTIRSKQTIHKLHIDTLFLNRRGKGLSRVMIFTMVKAIVEASRVNKNVSPHTFRHSFATHLVEGGADLRIVQEMLGHTNITTTEIYTHLNSDFLRQEIISYHPRA
jgi:integrase/recombinase XerD